MLKKVVAIVGMAGSGKSEVSRVFENRGWVRVRFGDITDIEMKKRELDICEASERLCREDLRKEFGMAAYAILNRPRIDSALSDSNVVADGLYSWEEYLSFKEYYGERFYVIAVCSSPETRYNRLSGRNNRPLSRAEARSRDKAEIENLNKGGPIAMADFSILNENGLSELRQRAEWVAAELEKG